MPRAAEAPELAHRWSGTAGPTRSTVVLLHGLGDSGDCWPDAVRRWSPSWRVVGVDLLGHGLSPRFTAAQLAARDPMEEMYAGAEATVARLVAESGGKVVLVSHSMGGGMAGALASRRPDLVRAAVLEEPAWRDPEVRVQPAQVVADRIAECRAFADDPAGQRARGRSDNPTWPEVELDPWAAAKSQVDLDFLALGIANLLEPWDDIVRRITVPVLAIRGSDSALITTQIADRAVALGNEHLELVTVDDANHCVRRDQPDAYHALVDPWLTEHA
jgi:pimeloyl-ACP methyl ester carboxylesterase